MKIAEIKEMTTADLAERIQTEQANYKQMLLNHAVSPAANSVQIKAARRASARLKTVLRQRESNQ